MELYTIEVMIVDGEELYRLTILETGEVRESRVFVNLLKSLVHDHGFYLRKIGG